MRSRRLLLLSLLLAGCRPLVVGEDHPAVVPTFAPPYSHPLPSISRSVVAADLRGRGTQDLIVANFIEGGSAVSVLLGNGDGTFAMPTTYGSWSSSAVVAAADFDGDRKIDLAMADKAFATRWIGVLYGVGDGTFPQDPVTQSLLAPADNLATGDFEGNGLSDLVAATRAGAVQVLVGMAGRTLRPRTALSIGGTPISLSVADFDGDQRDDLVTASPSTGQISVHRSRGDGSFFAPAEIAMGAGRISIDAGDLDGDGKPDLAVANQGGEDLTVLLGRGDGTLSPQAPCCAARELEQVAIADLNRDGHADLAMVVRGRFCVSPGLGDGRFDPIACYSTPHDAVSFALADFDRDGRLDVALVGMERPPQLDVLLNTTP